MADKTMKVKFKTKTTADGKTEPAGKVFTMPEDKAQEFIKRGLAVEVKPTAEELAKEKAESEARSKAEAEAKAKAEAEAKEKTAQQTPTK